MPRAARGNQHVTCPQCKHEFDFDEAGGRARKRRHNEPQTSTKITFSDNVASEDGQEACDKRVQYQNFVKKASWRASATFQKDSKSMRTQMLDDFDEFTGLDRALQSNLLSALDKVFHFQCLLLLRECGVIIFLIALRYSRPGLYQGRNA